MKNITKPVLYVYGKFDHLVHTAACELLTSEVETSEVEDVRIETGHIGINVSSESQKQLTPKIVEWLSKESHR